METVKELVERLHVKYAQIVNCADKTWKGVVACQNLWVRDYQYDNLENLVYIWV